MIAVEALLWMAIFLFLGSVFMLVWIRREISILMAISKSVMQSVDRFDKNTDDMK